MADPPRRDIVYATVDQGPLMLDLYLPENPVPSEKHHLHPLIIWVHGGAWRMGSRKDIPLLALRNKGFATASVDYRLSTAARFPAQIHDLKAAIRHLRRHAAEYGLDPTRFAIAGASAGGHLAALAGLARDELFPKIIQREPPPFHRMSEQSFRSLVRQICRPYCLSRRVMDSALECRHWNFFWADSLTHSRGLRSRPALLHM